MEAGVSTIICCFKNQKMSTHENVESEHIKSRILLILWGFVKEKSISSVYSKGMHMNFINVNFIYKKFYINLYIFIYI